MLVLFLFWVVDELILKRTSFFVSSGPFTWLYFWNSEVIGKFYPTKHNRYDQKIAMPIGFCHEKWSTFHDYSTENVQKLYDQNLEIAPKLLLMVKAGIPSIPSSSLVKPFLLWMECSLVETFYLAENHVDIEKCRNASLLGTNISLTKALLKMIFLFSRWDIWVPWRIIKQSVLFEMTDAVNISK